MNTEEKQTELQAVEVLTPELLTIAETSGLVLTEAQAIGSKFAPYMSVVNDLSTQINDLKCQEITPEIAKSARKLRLELVSNRGSKGLLATKEELKAGLLTRTRLIDKYVGVVEESSKLSEQAAESIEKHAERVEEARLEKVKSDRVALLLPYGEVNQYIDLKAMDETAFNNLLADTKLAYETRRENERLAELKRLEDEKKAEQERIEAEKKAEEARLKKEQEDKAERERIEAENEDLRKKELERQQAEIKRVEKELAKVEKFAKILVADGFELSNNDSYIPKDQHRWCKDEYSVSFGQLTLIESGDELKELIDTTNNRISERKRLEKEQADKDAEIAKLKYDKEAERLRKEKELAEEKARIEAETAEKLAKEKAALLAPDKDKVKEFFTQFDALIKMFPELKSEPGIVMSKRVNEALSVVRKLIIEDSKTLL